MVVKGWAYVPQEQEDLTKDVFMVQPSLCPTTWPKDNPEHDDAWYKVEFYMRNCYTAYETQEQMMEAILESVIGQFPANFSELKITRYKPKKQSKSSFDESYPGHWKHRPMFGPNRTEEHREDGWRYKEYNHSLIEDVQREQQKKEVKRKK